MGLLGGIFLLGGLAGVGLGLVGVGLGIFMGQWDSVGYSIGIFIAGVVAGTIGTVILE